MGKKKSKRKSLRWYRETHEVYLGKRSLRFFDSDTGYWVICFMLGKRTLCYYWDPAKYSFKSRVDSAYVCGVKMCGYCSRTDRSKNIRVEAESCREIYRWRTARYENLREMYDYIFEAGYIMLEDARDMIRNCFQDQPCVDNPREGIMLRTKVSKMRRLAYDRCDGIPKECDPNTCTCHRVSEEKVEMLWWKEELNLIEELEIEGEVSDCIYFETMKKWACKEYEQYS
ncbi:MAG: hypothetical protein JHC26_11560 [Thermofilum sp.]|jgi:hypothetical protein|uniref:hypothetical protein n=1 Tax=Thermofilum sp. TaxID=1961369 RepID=UPI00258BA137|nr:hypothetical protein [Thermofilum sp.]MCI4409719.1 hypothetical protein [Thermofilum sp.]